MRKRYQNIHRRGDTLPKKTTGFKKDAYKQRREKTYEHDDIYEAQKKQALSIGLSNTDIPPQLESLMRLMIAQRVKRKKNKLSLIHVMIIVAMMGVGINLILAGGINVGGAVKDAFQFVFILGIIAAVVIPVGFLCWKLEAVMSKDNAARVGAAIILGLIFLFLYWLASNWGGGYY